MEQTMHLEEYFQDSSFFKMHGFFQADCFFPWEEGSRHGKFRARVAPFLAPPGKEACRGAIPMGGEANIPMALGGSAIPMADPCRRIGSPGPRRGGPGRPLYRRIGAP